MFLKILVVKIASIQVKTAMKMTIGNLLYEKQFR